MSDDILPLYTGVVRLKSYGKGDDVHVCRSKRPHLFVLTPDAIQVFTTADAGPALDAEPPTLATLASAKTVSMATRKQGPLGRMSRRTLLAGASDDEAPPPPADGDPEELVEGQVFRLGVALNQVLGVQLVPGKPERLKVYYQPNRPSKKGSVEEQTMQVLRSMLRSMDVTRWGSSAAAAPPLPSHANAHHFTIVTESPQEALEVKEEVERAQEQLAMAVLWLSEGLPLRAASSVTLLAVGTSGAPSSASSTSSAFSPAPHASVPGSQAFVIPFPGWGVEVELPGEVSGALACPGSRRSVSTVVRAYLSTPLGPATADVPVLALLQSAAEGSAPVATPAVLQDPPDPGSPLRPARRWQVMLQWRAVKGEPVLPPVRGGSAGAGGGATVEISGGSGTGSLAGGSSPVASEGLGARDPGASRFGRERGRELAAPTAGVRAGAGSVAVLVGLAALSGATAVARRVRAQLGRLRGGGAGALAPPGAPQPWHRWRLVLLEVSIERETERSKAAMPPVKRALSMSAPPAASAAAAPGAAAPLPHHIELLARQYPAIITEDIARRFIVGLGSETKAFSALSTMAHWTTENRLTNVVARPQPAFAAMKRHYPHGFPGWSARRDCLVEVECMGRWPRAYEGIAAEGVSEQAMLEHLLFVYQYAFSRLDARPLPDGKTVKIVDLEGLGMGDLRTLGFKLITRVGAMLAMNFPQRSARVFLVNAPGWWAVAWKLVSPIIPPRVRAQMSLHGGGRADREAARKAMLEWVDEEVLPAAYGGKNEAPMAEWVLEREMAAYVEELNRQEQGGGGEGGEGPTEDLAAFKSAEECLPADDS